jgi:hypothetical protein
MQRAAFIAEAKRIRENYKPPEILRCGCGESATIAHTKIGGHTTFYCVEHEGEAMI